MSNEVIESIVGGPALQSPLSRPGMPNSSRQPRFDTKEIDPLLATLSPGAILDAFRAKETMCSEPEGPQKVLREVIAQASASEKALGARAALAGKKLEEWYQETEHWVWPLQSFEEPSRGIGSRDAHDFGSLRASVGKSLPVFGELDEVYWGSLPRAIVQEMALRIDSIRNAIDELNLEELKDHIRRAHLQSSPQGKLMSGFPNEFPNPMHSHLDDFTVILTATIMRALPFVTRLNRLLDTWSVRLAVLRMVPSFFNLLSDTQAAISSAWKVILASDTKKSGHEVSLNRGTITTMKMALSEKVGDLGRVLDAMLDYLEGHDDNLPDHWIDRMESAQVEYESWVFKAERLIGRNEMSAHEHLQDMKEQVPISEEAEQVTHHEDNVIHRYTSEVSARKSTDETSANSSRSPNEPYDTLPSTRTEKVNGETRSPPSHAATEPIKAALPMIALRESMNLATENQSSRERSGILPSPRIMEAPDLETLSRIDTLRPQADYTFQSAKSTDEMRLETESNMPLIVEVPSRSTLALERPVEAGFAFPDGMETPESLFNFQHEPPSLLRKSTIRPAPLDLGKVNEHIAHSDLSHPSSSASETFSEMSSPEIMDASQIQFFKTPTEDKPVFWATDEPLSIADVSRNSSQRTQPSPGNMRNHTEPSGLIRAIHSRSRSSTMTSIHRPIDISETSSEDDLKIHRYAPLKRASVTSIETIPRSELRSIEVRRSASYSSARSTMSLQSVTRERAISSAGSQGSQRLQESPLKSMADWEKVASKSMASRKEHFVLPALVISKHMAPSRPGSREEDFPISSVEGHSPPPIIPHNDVSSDILPSIEYDDEFINTAEKAPNLPKRPKNHLSIDDQLKARISSILTRIPVSIRLANGPESMTPESRIPSRSGTPQPGSLRNVTPSTRPMRERSSTPALTLAPAYGKTTPKPRNIVDSEIKLYHLHQPGRDQPIKLYVRLVGEGGERVMVRVGGGWADLGEYLKEYAAHHGQRSASDGHFEIKELPNASPGPSVGLPTSNGRSPSYSTSIGGRSTPTSATHSRAGSAELRSLVIQKTRLSNAADTSLSSSPDAEQGSQDAATTSPARSSRIPSLGPTLRQRSMSGTPGPEDDVPLSLAGPRRGGKTEIGPRKQAWVDGMMDQARRVSGDQVTPEAKKKDSGGGGKGLVGEIGRVGNVRRVFMKGWSRDEGS